MFNMPSLRAKLVRARARVTCPCPSFSKCVNNDGTRLTRARNRARARTSFARNDVSMNGGE